MNCDNRKEKCDTRKGPVGGQELRALRIRLSAARPTEQRVGLLHYALGAPVGQPTARTWARRCTEGVRGLRGGDERLHRDQEQGDH
eukprot:640146-Heterocapsa_arctica.AAC.1